MSNKYQQHLHSGLKHASINNWNYTEYIPVIPHHLTNSYEYIYYDQYDIWSSLLVLSDFAIFTVRTMSLAN